MNIEHPDSNRPLFQWLTQGNRPALLSLALIAIATTTFLVVNQMPAAKMCYLFEDYRPTFAEQNRILAALGSTELTGHNLENGRIMVPAALKGKFLAAIEDKSAMPDVLVKEAEFKPNPFLPRSQLRLQQLAQKKKQVCEMIERLPFVLEAQFEFDREDSRELFQPHKQTAVVMVTPVGNSLINRQQLQSVQRTVASAIAGIQPYEVAVIDSNAGIAYDDIRELEQANLIELVNWKMERQAHYKKLLDSMLRPNFPGIDIKVTVHIDRDASLQPQTDQRRVFKLASKPQQEQPAPGIGLNTTTTVTVGPNPTADPVSIDSRVTKTSFEAILPHATQTIRSEAGFDLDRYKEKLSIKITIPNLLIESTALERTETLAECFQDLSEQISARVKSELPAEMLAETFPIDISPENQLALDKCSVNNGNVWNMRNLWPFWAVLLTGVFAAITVRKQNSRKIANESTGPSQRSNTLDLEQQLSELIESDPGHSRQSTQELDPAGKLGCRLPKLWRSLLLLRQLPAVVLAFIGLASSLGFRDKSLENFFKNARSFFRFFLALLAT